MIQAALLHDADITLERLRALFQQAAIRAELDEDGDLAVYPGELKAFVHLNEANRQIRYVAYYGIDENAPRLDKLELLNRMNREYIFARFALVDEEAISADFYLPFEGGVSAELIVESLQLFCVAVPAAIAACDEARLIQ
ncbi:YbjN domain-containing protein [Crenobacter sp. SG2303]|uniref:YbjN domain-containing protein n=1 Tax=Crenobacter oryzisoli TaxID=3056844 RepID=A0ABT7XN15_9NEIS|nr:YbjN domain-containing protein [Crenobacter sp. SG2303]MDN0075198.1 YbjN domain-containing protein [Crenobacter sp. SG2303]